MKRKDIYLLAIILFSITLAFSIITGLIYIQRTNQIKKITVKSKQNINIIKIRDLYDVYQFITPEDTFDVTKKYHPALDLKTIEQIDLNENFTIKYAAAELVSLKNDNQEIFEIDLIKTKKEARDAFAAEAFYWYVANCTLLMLGFIFVPLEKRAIQKVENNILKIPNTVKIKKQLFQYSYRNVEFLLLHQYFTNSHYIRVYIPVNAENLICPNNMHTEKIDEQPYCYFDFGLFTSYVNATKLQAKIDSKFKKHL